MIEFWNGNKSLVRQHYELEVLKLLLEKMRITETLVNNTTSYSDPVQEGEVLDNGASLLATVAGNQKFVGRDFIEVPLPLARGVMGWRLLVINNDRKSKFDVTTVNDLRQKIAGIPAHWADAELFRKNGHEVVEKGTLDQMLKMLRDAKVDYVPLGAIEAEKVIENSSLSSELKIEMSWAIYYPLPIVFYVNLKRPDLATMLEKALMRTEESGELQSLFDQYYKNILDSAKITDRKVIYLDNPFLSSYYIN
ncbi:transporter substrate-binding domain-containing protein [Salinivibrio sp. EAGSL]|uniref:substrate-binding periplasmic protein n=1 Tax=Salinivibrio sp. EAGSL TaxID=2738468 RepID=UPI00158B3D0A|nr:transporter substrate-binding domain-containing protein [Salinivibrio sp. EAGSL]NUY57357.1 transporter substrate-binding domain-containing protein [Salinivibrio sp. EAGSL]